MISDARMPLLATILLALTYFTLNSVQSQTTPVRNIPARTLPTPTTVSPELQKEIAPAWNTNTSPAPTTNQQWKAMIQKDNEPEANKVDALLKEFHVTLEHKTIAGVPVFLLKPDTIAQQNRNRLLVHVHGGGYVVFAGKAATPEAILMAHYGQIEVISVDYRMPPDFPFPAAIDDTVAV